jgi:pimeloyl-ACP methyl ester carboxylesterase
VALSAQGFRDHFGQDLPDDEIALLHATQGPFAQGSNDETIGTAAWRAKPTWFVMGENDHMLLFDLEKATAEKLGAKTLVPRSSHLPMLSQPYAVADFIQEAANQLGGSN